MKRSIFLVLIVLMAILAFYLVFFRGKSTLGSKRTQFALGDKNKVTEIIITSGSEELSLNRSDEYWEISNEKVDKQKIADLLLLHENLEILSPAPLSNADSIADCLDSAGSIQFLSGNKTMLAYKLCTFHKQLFARKMGGSKIFRVASRGFSDVDLSQLLSTEKSFWLGNTLISVPPTDIRLVNIHYFPESENDFALYSEGVKIAVKGAKRELKDSEIDKTFVNDYLQYFSGITFEKPENEKNVLDILQQEQAFFSIQLINAKGEETRLAGFRIPGENTPVFNPYKFCALTGNGKCILLNYSDFDPILVGFHEFLKN